MIFFSPTIIYTTISGSYIQKLILVTATVVRIIILMIPPQPMESSTQCCCHVPAKSYFCVRMLPSCSLCQALFTEKFTRNVGRKCTRRRTTFLRATKFACSGHPANFRFTSYGGGIVTPFSGYSPPSTAAGNMTFATLLQSLSWRRKRRPCECRETYHTAINAMGSINSLFNKVKPIIIGYE